jgi:hypothetical protein
MTTTLIIIIGFLFIAVVVLFSTIAVYLHIRMDNIVKIVNKNGSENCKNHNIFNENISELSKDLETLKKDK